MPSYESCRSTVIPASPQACFDSLTHYAELPAWQSSVIAATVLETDSEGRGRTVEYEVDARVQRVRYVLEHTYDEPHRIGSRYIEGDFRDFAGEWSLTPADEDRTRAKLSVRIDPGRIVPRPLRSAISNAVVRRALRDLQSHVPQMEKV